jgi:glyoxylate/hydroxypyruvate reductase A
MALLYVIKDWDADAWLGAMRALNPGIDLRSWPDAVGRAEEIRYALAWRPPAGALHRLANLQVIFSLGAGVDSLLAGGELPPVPIVRVVDRNLTMRMSEYVVLHVLLHHRRQRILDGQQQRRQWRGPQQPAACEVRVGILGFGHLGQDAGRRLRDLGFQVAGWSRSRKHVRGIQSFAGAGELKAFLNRTEILVSLLPLTPGTHGILNLALFRELARDGRLGAPILINAGRGKSQVEADIVAALDQGILQAATLDVFETEPLPPESPLWSHPKVTLTPHNAADSDPGAISRYVLTQIRRFEAGAPLQNVVDRNQGY